jgi:uncharacterized protein
MVPRARPRQLGDHYAVPTTVGTTIHAMIQMLALLALLVGCDERDPIARVVGEDPPADPKFPAAMEPVAIPSGDVKINGVLYLASGSQPHPTVVLLHGFPGNEQNLDLAQAIRRAGWNTLTFHYRGSWGSPGAFSFGRAVDDARAAVAFVRSQANAAKYRIDPAKVIVIGHSMGGFIAAKVTGDDPTIAGVGLIAAWPIWTDAETWATASQDKLVSEAEAMRPDTVPLAGTTAEALIQEAVAHRDEWNFVKHATAIGARPALVINTDDGAAPIGHAYAEAVRATELHLATDHALSDHRIALQSAVVRWLRSLR